MSFTHLCSRIATIVCLANQQARGLENTSVTDSLLNSDLNVFPPAADDDYAKMVGCYVTEDANRHKLIRSGMTTTSFGKREKQHARASRLQCEKTKNRRLYRSYPHRDAAHLMNTKKGTWDQLNQRVAAGLKANKKQQILDMFEWSDSDECHLAKLMLDGNDGKLDGNDGNAGGTIQDKRFKHLCFMFETFYAVAIDPHDNITQNPGCEWQLEIYSKYK